MSKVSKIEVLGAIALELLVLGACTSGARISKSNQSFVGKPSAISQYQPSRLESEALAGVNAARISGYKCGGEFFPPVAKLSANQELTVAALKQARSMASSNLFSHVGINGDTVGDRISASGYTWKACGENIAAGQMTSKQVVAGWLKSPGHCKNIMNGNYQEMGIAQVRSKNTTYWVQTFGAK